MSDLDLLPRGQQRESAPLGTMQWLSDTAERVSEHMPLTHSQREQLLHIVVDRMRSQTGATGAAVALEQFGQMVCRASSGDTAPDVGAPLRLEGSFTGRCIQSGAALRCDDSESDPRVNPEACRMLGIRSMLVVPVRNQDRVMGVVEVLSNEPRAFTNAHQSTLESVATVISETFFEPLPDEYVSEPVELDAFAEALQRKHPARPAR
jgi:GAF domain-containing protein